MKKLCFLFVLLAFGNVSHSLAQYAMPQYPVPQPQNNTFNIQVYQQKLQKFIETLTPQEKMLFMLSQNKRSLGLSSNSTVEEKLDEIYEKIDDIYDKVDDVEYKLRHGSYYVNCNRY